MLQLVSFPTVKEPWVYPSRGLGELDLCVSVTLLLAAESTLERGISFSSCLHRQVRAGSEGALGRKRGYWDRSYSSFHLSANTEHHHVQALCQLWCYNAEHDMLHPMVLMGHRV